MNRRVIQEDSKGTGLEEPPQKFHLPFVLYIPGSGCNQWRGHTANRLFTLQKEGQHNKWILPKIILT